jgi:hypothetical protein
MILITVRTIAYFSGTGHLDVLKVLFFFLFFWARSQNFETDYWLRPVCPSTWNNLAPSGRMLLKSDIREFFENLLRKIKV